MSTRKSNEINYVICGVIINVNHISVKVININIAEVYISHGDRRGRNCVGGPFLDKNVAGAVVSDRQAGRTIYAQVGGRIGGDRRRRQRYSSRGLNFESGILIGVGHCDVACRRY